MAQSMWNIKKKLDVLTGKLESGMVLKKWNFPPEISNVWYSLFITYLVVNRDVLVASVTACDERRSVCLNCGCPFSTRYLITFRAYKHQQPLEGELFQSSNLEEEIQLQDHFKSIVSLITVDYDFYVAIFCCY